MRCRILIVTFIGLISCVLQPVNGATTILKQLPFANATDPDHHRANGYCNDDNACAPGWYCNSFGYCERR